MTNNPVLLQASFKYLFRIKTALNFIIYLCRLFFGQYINLSSAASNQPRLNSDAMQSQVRGANILRVETALKEHGDALLRLSHSYLHNISDAEDILQETLIQMLRKAPVFECLEHEKAWLLRVAINLCKNKIKYNQRRRWEELSESLSREIPEDLSFVWDTVASLPVKYREVIHLFYQEDMTTKKIAKLLDKQESTVRSLLHRARGYLKDELKEVYDFEE